MALLINDNEKFLQLLGWVRSFEGEGRGESPLFNYLNAECCKNGLPAAAALRWAGDKNYLKYRNCGRQDRQTQEEIRGLILDAINWVTCDFFIWHELYYFLGRERFTGDFKPFMKSKGEAAVYNPKLDKERCW